MSKTLVGTVVSTKMHKTVVVEVIRQKPHPLYRKLLKRSKRFKAEISSHMPSLGDLVRIGQTRPQASGKHFAITEVLTKKGTERSSKAKEKNI